MRTEVIRDRAEMDAFATRTANAITPGSTATVLALSGDLGAGKTTFTQGLARALGVEDVVPSPTFVILRRYPLQNGNFTTLIHIDAYRIDDETELSPLHLEELMKDPQTLLVIEWPERVPTLAPAVRYTLRFVHGAHDERTVTHNLPHVSD